MEKNIFIDVSNYIHRVFQAMIYSELKSKYKNYDDLSKEEKQEAKESVRNNLDNGLVEHNIMNGLELLLKMYKIEQKNMYLVFDSNSWRNDFLDNSTSEIKYKEGREDTFKKQIKSWINWLLEISSKNLNYKTMKIDDLEADDIIALLAKKLENKECKNIIVSNDKDFFQLMKLINLYIYHPFTKKEMKYTYEEAERALQTKLFSGDRSDKITNILPTLRVEIEKQKREEIKRKEILNEKGEVDTKLMKKEKYKLNKEGEWVEIKTNLVKEILEITNIQLGEKTVDKMLIKNNNLPIKTLYEVRDKIFKKQPSTKKEPTKWQKYSLEEIFSLLKEKYLINKTMIDFEEIPDNLVKRFEKEYLNLNKPEKSKKEIFNYYQSIGLKQLSKNYEESTDLYQEL